MILSVSQLADQVLAALSGTDFKNIRVRGEVSNVATPPSGHVYFTLRDAGAQIACVAWRNVGIRPPEPGQEVLVAGDLTTYKQRGVYQIAVRAVSFEGEGQARAKKEAFVERLRGEGLLDPERRRPLPTRPGRVGVVTSRKGAALQDFLRAVAHRNPAQTIVLAHSVVQGESAPESVARAVERLQDQVDVIVVTRGGGSAEDLAAFDEEVVVRAVAASKVPVVSAIGHEVDHPLTDLVADLRARTPTHAGEVVAPDAGALVADLWSRLKAPVSLRVLDAKERAALASSRLALPARRRLEWLRGQLDAASAQFAQLDPRAVLRRGYAAIALVDGTSVRGVADVAPGSQLEITLHDGAVLAEVLP